MERCTVHEQRERFSITVLANLRNEVGVQLAVQRMAEHLHVIDPTIARDGSDSSHVRLVSVLAINRHSVVCPDVVDTLQRVFGEDSFVSVDDWQALSHRSFDIGLTIFEFGYVLLKRQVAS